jgi:hypothetical protein
MCLVVKTPFVHYTVFVSNSATFVECHNFDFFRLILFHLNSISECRRFSAVNPLACKTGNVNLGFDAGHDHVILLKAFCKAK